MGTPLGQNGTAGPPSIKLRNQGDYVDCAVFNEEIVPAREFGTGNQKLKADGSPKMQDKVSVIVVRGTGAITVDDPANPGQRVERVVVEGDVATIYFEGQNRYDPDRDAVSTDGFKSWSGAKKDLGQLQCGDILRWRYDGEVQGKGAQPRKIRVVKLRRPKPEEAALTTRCEELLRQGTAVPIGAGAQGPFDRGEDF